MNFLVWSNSIKKIILDNLQCTCTLKMIFETSSFRVFKRIKVMRYMYMQALFSVILFDRITNTGVQSLAEGSCAASLRELNLTNCIRVGDMAMFNIRKWVPSFVTVNQSTEMVVVWILWHDIKNLKTLKNMFLEWTELSTKYIYIILFIQFR